MRFEVEKRCVSVILLISAIVSKVSASGGDGLNMVFTDKEVAQCGRMRLPQLIWNNDTSTHHIIATCCGKNGCSSKPDEVEESYGVSQLDSTSGGQNSSIRYRRRRRRMDDFSYAKVVMKTSTDGAVTWSNFQYISPKGQDHYATGAGLYDAVRKRIIVQFAYFPLGTTKGVTKISYLQRYSKNDGKSWGDIKDISSMVELGCNAVRGEDGVKNKVYQSAGSKVQLATGRLLFPYKALGGPVCVIYSDDGGGTWNASNLFKGNEVSVAIVNPKYPNEVYMNGRGQQFSWGSTHRTEYFSHDGGATWSKGSMSMLTDGTAGQTERAVVRIGNAMYASGPMQKGRSAMRIYCSTDGGRTWPAFTNVNGDAQGGYSDLAPLRTKHKLLMVWEDGQGKNDATNFIAGRIPLFPCPSY